MFIVYTRSRKISTSSSSSDPKKSLYVAVEHWHRYKKTLGENNLVGLDSQVAKYPAQLQGEIWQQPFAQWNQTQIE